MEELEVKLRFFILFSLGELDADIANNKSRDFREWITYTDPNFDYFTFYQNVILYEVF